MQVLQTRAEARAWSARSRQQGLRTALVPTMGSLHEGHLSLVEIAKQAADRVALSIFVNPLQFGPGEDFERYPRDLPGDVDAARAAGVDVVFAPTAAEMYPQGEPWTTVIPEKGGDRLCGSHRPGHFRGVLTIVAKLFGIFHPDAAVFGQKDYQQFVLIRRMVADLDYAVEVIAGPIVREADGLAMSSRNRYLAPDERRSARALSRALRDCESLFRAGERNAEAYRERLHRASGAGVSLEYGEAVDPVTLSATDEIAKGVVCMLAARAGATRLIDNHILGTGPMASAPADSSEFDLATD
ncbi:MAG: pantoate--beta-alanine ligase [Gemmatimonadota bacterium]